MVTSQKSTIRTRQEMPIARRTAQTEATRTRTTAVLTTVDESKRTTHLSPAAMRRKVREAEKKRGDNFVFFGVVVLEIIVIAGFGVLRSIIELGANGLGDAIFILLKVLGISL